ncbi:MULTISPECIES: sugar nucleotide-binding protein [unclassified Streptomyces]|uniref:sugar nucleotide-binding protein n=1 Tax=unclassified Streptomyces TaxID=2593676 RepID=UPI0033DE15D1
MCRRTRDAEAHPGSDSTTGLAADPASVMSAPGRDRLGTTDPAVVREAVRGHPEVVSRAAWTSTAPSVPGKRQRPSAARAYATWHGPARCARYCIVRAPWPHGAHGRNFVAIMLELATRSRPPEAVSEQHGQPTCSHAPARRLAVFGRAALAGKAPAGPRHGGRRGPRLPVGPAARVGPGQQRAPRRT